MRGYTESTMEDSNDTTAGVELTDEQVEAIASGYVEERFDMDLRDMGYLKSAADQLNEEIERSEEITEPSSRECLTAAFCHIRWSLICMEEGWYDRAYSHQQSAELMMQCGGVESL